LTEVVGNDDSWQHVFGGDGEEAGDRSGDREHRRGEQLHEAGDVAGHPSDVRAAHTSRFILVALLVKHPKFLSAISQSKQFKHVFKAAEERTRHAIRDLRERNGLQVYIDLRLSQDAYQRLINLTTHKWDEDMEEMVILVLPRGSQMCKWPAVPTVPEIPEQELNVVGLQPPTDFVSTTLDISLVLQQRARRLLKKD
jgi:hypothetical protein